MSLIYKPLARHPGIWRVDGIGPILLCGRLGTRSTVCFSRLKKSASDNRYSKTASDGDTLALTVHTSSLSIFKVGSIWEAGQRIEGPPLIKTAYSIDARQIRWITLNQTVDLNGRSISAVLPEKYYGLGKNRLLLSPTLYGVVPVVDDPTHWLVIPAAELVRFYIGVSGRLLARTLTGRLDYYVDWTRSRVEDGRPVLHAKQRLNRKEAAVLARALVSRAARSALHGVHQHLAVTHANNAVADRTQRRPLIVKARFPFEDQTSLYVAGKHIFWALNSKGQRLWAVFVMEILHCSHAFGFSRLTVETEQPIERQAQADGGEGVSLPPYHDPKLEGDEEDFELEDLPADARLRRLAILDYSNQFAGMRGLKMTYRYREAHRLMHAPGQRIEVPVRGLTLDDGGHGDDARGNLGIGGFQSRVETVDRDLGCFLAMLKRLRRLTEARGWSIDTRKADDGLLHEGEVIAFFPDKVGKRHTWHKVADPDGTVRPRQVVWAEIIEPTHESFFYLLEMELKPGETGQCTLLLHTNHFTRLNDPTFNTLLRLTAIQNRWPSPHNTWIEERHRHLADRLFDIVRTYRIRHPPQRQDVGHEVLKNVQSKIDPALWSQNLLERVREFFIHDVK